ncbi:hypothetical protein Ct9H90mP29_04680 [bacterium]|nr:MAG: hypothetical protein Ct9H90mP29_04680 [bacterium]
MRAFDCCILAIYASNMLWVYGIFIAIGIGQGAFMPSAMNLFMIFQMEKMPKPIWPN